MSETLTLSYALDSTTLLKGMVWAGAEIQKNTDARARWVRYLILFLVIVAGQVALGFAERTFGWQFSWAGFAAGFATLGLAGYLLQRSVLRKLSETACEGIMRRGSVELTISAAGLVERSGVGRLEVGWSSVDQIGEVDGATVIRIAAMCIVIPDTALPEATGRRVFIDMLDAKREADKVFG